MTPHDQMKELADDLSCAYGRAADVESDYGVDRAEPYIVRALGLRLTFHACAREHGLLESEPAWGVYSRSAELGGVPWLELEPIGTSPIERSADHLTARLAESHWFDEGEAWQNRRGRPRALTGYIVYFGIVMAAEGLSTRQAVATAPGLGIAASTLSTRLRDPWTQTVLLALCHESARAAGRGELGITAEELELEHPSPWGKTEAGRLSARLCSIIARNIRESIEAQARVCEGCGFRVFVTARGRLRRHLPTESARGFAASAYGVSLDVPRCEAAKRPHKAWTDEDRSRLAQLAGTGTVASIAETMGRTVGSVRTQLYLARCRTASREAGQDPEPRETGEGNGRVLLL